ncbi:glycosyltransferase family 2 protein [Methanospirillum purgamenti]|nr:glycosyltransferase [Methanospirillum hungatei]
MMIHYLDLLNYTLIRKQSEIITPKGNIKSYPKISIIVPVYMGSVSWLREAIHSVMKQDYQNWEICLIDDGSNEKTLVAYLNSFSDSRIKVKINYVNRGVSDALNRGIELSTGEYLTFLDQDDLLLPGALSEIVTVINEKTPDFIYTDEEMMTDSLIGRFLIQPHFKPDFSQDLLFSHNYITHLMVLKRDLLNEIGWFRTEYNGAQDYDLALRATERAEKIWHIRKVLYRWRIHGLSLSHTPSTKKQCGDAGKSILESALIRREIHGWVVQNILPYHYRVKRAINGNPLVSIIIPFSDRIDLLNTCITSIIDKTTYQNWEIIGVSNNSKENSTHLFMNSLEEKDHRIRFIHLDIPFNYSYLNNHAVNNARGDYLVFMNNDIEIISPDWIETLLEHSQRDEIGAVGAKLYYPDGFIQHAGVVTGIQGFAGHPYRFYPKNHYGYFFGLMQNRNVSAVTAALMMISKQKFLSVGGFDVNNLAISLNDIDLCLRLLELKYLNVFTPFCEAFHNESASRGYETTPEQKERFAKETDYFIKRHQGFIKKGDPWYNPNLSLEDEMVRIRHKWES